MPGLMGGKGGPESPRQSGRASHGRCACHDACSSWFRFSSPSLRSRGGSAAAQGSRAVPPAARVTTAAWRVTSASVCRAAAPASRAATAPCAVPATTAPGRIALPAAAQGSRAVPPAARVTTAAWRVTSISVCRAVARASRRVRLRRHPRPRQRIRLRPPQHQPRRPPTRRGRTVKRALSPASVNLAAALLASAATPTAPIR